MTALIVAIFVASVLGSLHCAGMCGAFLAIALGDASAPRWQTQAMYHGGRLATYLTMGAAAGALGHAIDLAGTLAGLQPVAAALAGATLIVFGVTSYLKLKGYATGWFRPPAFMARLSGKGLGVAMNRGVLARAGMIGLLTTLLPCGWLYAFVATAAGTASPVKGMVAMGAFWLGTLPVMVTLGTGLREGLGAIGKRVPALTCLALVAVGLYTLVGRGSLSAARLLTLAEAAAHPTTTVGTTETTTRGAAGSASSSGEPGGASGAGRGGSVAGVSREASGAIDPSAIVVPDPTTKPACCATKKE